MAWGSAIFLAARDAARSSASLQSTVDRVDELRQAATRLSRDFVTMQTSRRAFLLTGDQAAERAQVRAEISAVQQLRQLRRLSVRWRSLAPAVEGWPTSTGPGSGPATPSWPPAAGAGPARPPWPRPAATPTGTSAGSGTAQTLAVRTALMLLGALVLRAIWLRRAVGAPADALRSASGRLAGGDLETPVELGVENELGAVASDLETMRRRLAGRMEALERLRHLSAQVVGATSLQRLAEVVLEGLRPEIGATRAVLGAARPGGDLALRALAGFPDPAGADDIAKADAELHLVLPLHTLRAGQVVAWPTSTR